MGGLKLDRPPPGVLHFHPSAFDPGHERLDVQAVGRLPLQMPRPGQGLSRRGTGLARGNHAEDRRKDGGLREAGPRRRVRRVPADGLLEGAEGPGEVLLPAKVPTLQVASVGLEVRGPRPDDDRVLPRREVGLDGHDDARGDFVLDREDVLGLAVESFRPELKAARGVGQLGGHSQPITRRPHAAFEHVTHGEGAGDRGHVAAVLPRAERRGPRRDADALDPDERVHDLLGHALAEEFLVLRGAHVRENGRTAIAMAVSGCLGRRIGFRPAGDPRAPPCADRRSSAPRTRDPTTSRTPAHGAAVIRPELEQIPQGFSGRVPFPELSVSGRQHRVRYPSGPASWP